MFFNKVPTLKRHLLHIVIILSFEYTPVPHNSERFTFPLLYVAIGSVVSVVMVVVTIAVGNIQLSVYIVIVLRVIAGVDTLLAWNGNK